MNKKRKCPETVVPTRFSLEDTNTLLHVFKFLPWQEHIQNLTISKSFSRSLSACKELKVDKCISEIAWQSFGNQFPFLQLLTCVDNDWVTLAQLKLITTSMLGLRRLWIPKVRLDGVEPCSFPACEIYIRDVDYTGALLLHPLPVLVKRLTFGPHFHQPLGPNVLPESLTHLNFSNVPFLQTVVWPGCLTHLESFHSTVMPKTLIRLTFSRHFNQPIPEGVLPESLLSLHFGSDFNQPIAEGVLPTSLLGLHFGNNFNQPINKGVLPASLLHLEFGWLFNQPINEGVLPGSLQQFIVFGDFNQSVVLPNSLTMVRFGYAFNLLITVWPTSLRSLTLSGDANFNQPGVLPQTLVSLTINENFNQLILVVLPNLPIATRDLSGC